MPGGIGVSVENTLVSLLMLVIFMAQQIATCIELDFGYTNEREATNKRTENGSV